MCNSINTHTHTNTHIYTYTHLHIHLHMSSTFFIVVHKLANNLFRMKEKYNYCYINTNNGGRRSTIDRDVILYSIPGGTVCTMEAFFSGGGGGHSHSSVHIGRVFVLLSFFYFQGVRSPSVNAL